MWTMHEIRYFDNAATTRMSRHSLDAYINVVQDHIGNPSSLHEEGRKAKELLEGTRAELASLLGVKTGELYFTAGASEANGIILSSLLWKQKPGEVVISGIEHPSALGYERLLKQYGWKVILLNAPNGFLCPSDLEKVLTKETRLVCMMLVNNVIGTIQDVKALTEVVRRFEQSNNGRKIHVHTDATQALGKITFDLRELDVDSAAFSAHKIHGPRGVGLLYNRNSAIESLSRGGDQERGLRAGTENVAGIVAMKEAVLDAYSTFDEVQVRVTMLNRKLRASLSGLPILSPAHDCSPFILTLAHLSLPSEVFTRMLFDRGFCVSSGSACSNNVKQKSQQVLNAMHIPSKLAGNSVRISLSCETTESDVQALIDTILTICKEQQ